MIRLVGLYACSGFLALVYEVLWMRLVSIQFGVSSFAVVVTVAAFMFGLGLGAWRFSKEWIPSLKTPTYLGWIEFGLSLFAIFLPTLVRISSPFIDSAAVRFSNELWHLLIILSALILLSIPAYAMGAGFSLVLKYVNNQTRLLPWIYGLNTFGAVLGALFPLWALPHFGWVASLRITALLGIALALSFWFLLPKTHNTHRAAGRPTLRPPISSLINYGILGALSLALEVAWTRLFGLIMLRTEYVLALILATFLLGIAIGSVLTVKAGRYDWLKVLPWVVSAGIFLSLLEWVPVSAYLETAQFSDFNQALIVQGLLMLGMTLSVTLSLGAWLPLLTNKFDNSGQWFYSVNALGGGVGALLTGFVFIPLLGTTTTLGLIAFLFLFLEFNIKNKIQWVVLPVAAGLLFWASIMPPTSRLLPQEMGHSHDIYHYEDAIAMTEVVEQPNGQRYLLTDLQRRDASSDPTAVFTQQNQVFFPLIYHGNPHSLLLLGLGTGISDEGSAQFKDLTRTAVELSRGAIIGAREWFAPLNKNALNQTVVIQDDARHFLSAHQDHYDVIVGDLFHPDLAGVSSLLSLEQFQRVRQHLNQHGLFVQWLALNQFDLPSFQVVLKTFKTVFPQAVMFMDGMHVALVGSIDDTLDVNGLFNKQAISNQQSDNLGESSITWLGRYWGAIPDNHAPLQDEWAPVIEFSLPRLHYSKANELVQVLSYMMSKRPSLDQAKKDLSLPAPLVKSFEGSYIASDFLVRSWLATFSGQDREADHLIQLAYQANPKDRWVDYALSDQLFANQKAILSQGMDEKTLLKRILTINPYHVEAWRSLWHLQQVEHDPSASSSLAQILRLAPLDLEANSAKNGGL
ncbi:fused MFS/spermidine synthase [Ferrovum sp. PN-J185]|uniref:fused MFS/spermidine synthase n=1 Tax=Ferrovum sp. PN-J185 TaxID=1356306 RepID=UPI001E3B2E90|nr:fused MFS/spermidine synthase [Ferrovum sp. PN-J185]MCC6067898.1 fused MFS/spermidine synthase [Ferrovum sp. PN-J185]